MTPGEDAMKTVEMTTKNLEYSINKLMKQRQGLRGLSPFLKGVLQGVKCYQTVLYATDISFIKGRVNTFNKLVLF